MEILKLHGVILSRAAKELLKEDAEFQQYLRDCIARHEEQDWEEMPSDRVLDSYDFPSKDTRGVYILFIYK